MKLIRLFWFLSVIVFAGRSEAQGNPVPFIAEPLAPAAAVPASAGFTLTVHGAGFVSGSIVNWNGTPLVTTFLSAGKLTAAVPAADVALKGTAMVTVVNPGPGGGSSDGAPFSITSPTSSLVFRSMPVGGPSSPLSSIAADFNHDGIPDLAITDQAAAPSCNYQFHGVGSIAILLGNGDGTFTKASTLCLLDFLSEEPTALALAGDLNRDGKLDLISVTSSSDSGHVAAYYGNGDGTFSAPQELGPSAFPAAMATRRFATPALSLFQQIKGIALGDFFRNGQLNVAVSQIDSTGAFNLFLLPENSFLSGGPVGPSTGMLSVGDFNSDGILDLADTNGFLRTFIDNGSGAFTEKPMIPFGGSATSIVNGDFNGDGIADLASVFGNSIAVLLGNGDGTFTAKTGQPVSPQTNVSLITADINGDGKLDFVVVDSANAVSVWLGKGDGTFQTPMDTTGRGDSAVAADFDRDGQMDLAVTDSVAGTVTVLLQGSSFKAIVEGPIDPDGSGVFATKRGNLPVRFTLTENGVPTCTLPAATITVTRTAGMHAGLLDEQIYAAPADKGSNFGIDQSACQYVYNLAARKMGPGKYRVDISIDGTSVGDAAFLLVAGRW